MISPQHEHLDKEAHKDISEHSVTSDVRRRQKPAKELILDVKILKNLEVPEHNEVMHNINLMSNETNEPGLVIPCGCHCDKLRFHLLPFENPYPLVILNLDQTPRGSHRAKFYHLLTGATPRGSLPSHLSQWVLRRRTPSLTNLPRQPPWPICRLYHSCFILARPRVRLAFPLVCSTAQIAG